VAEGGGLLIRSHPSRPVSSRVERSCFQLVVSMVGPGVACLVPSHIGALGSKVGSMRPIENVLRFMAARCIKGNVP